MNIVVRETVEVPAAPPVMWGEEEVNMPPAEWFRGVWYAERKRRQQERARREKAEKVVAAVMVAGAFIVMTAVCYLFGGY